MKSKRKTAEAGDVIMLCEDILRQNPDLEALLKRFHLDEQEYINSLQQMLSEYAFTEGSFSNTTNV